jgi:ArsR family transcriptional regulator, virulence genes transcriptional regulator
MKYPNLTRNIGVAARLLDALSSETRLDVLRKLSEHEFAADALAPDVGLGQPALSQLLAKLGSLGLIHVRWHGQIAYYRCDDLAVKRLLRAI